MKLIKSIKNGYAKLVAFLSIAIASGSVMADVPEPEGVGAADSSSGTLAYTRELWNFLVQWGPTILSFAMFLYLGNGLLNRFLEEKNKPKPEWNNVIGYAVGTIACLTLGVFLAFQASEVGTIS